MTVGHNYSLKVTATCPADGTRITELRRERKLSQRDLGAAAGCSKQMISLIETGAQDPSVTLLLAIAAALEVPFPLLVWQGPLDGRARTGGARRYAERGTWRPPRSRREPPRA